MNTAATNNPNVLGRHAIIDVWGCSENILSNTGFLREMVFKAANIANTTVLGSMEKHFEPQGYTVVLLLAESHLSLHTWPEIGFASADLFSCNIETDFAAVCEYLESSLEAQGSHIEMLERRMDPARLELSSLIQRNHQAVPAINGIHKE